MEIAKVRRFMNKYYIQLIIVLIIVSVIGIYFFEYPVGTNEEAFKLELRKYEEGKEISIQKLEEIEDSVVVLYTYENVIGYGVFEKGINGKCRFIYKTTNEGQGAFLGGFIGPSKNNNIFIVGKNYESRIKSMEFSYKDNTKFLVEIPKNEYFIQRADNLKGLYSIVEIKILDEKGNDIKTEIRRKYMGNLLMISSSEDGGVFTGFKILYGIIVLIGAVKICFRLKSKKHDINFS
jgi:hypothetical protein